MRAFYSFNHFKERKGGSEDLGFCVPPMVEGCFSGCLIYSYNPLAGFGVVPIDGNILFI